MINRKRHVLLFIIILLGVTGCMFNNDAKETDEMLDYLHSKYGGTFEAERLGKGSRLFPDMYGGDKLMAHPVEQPELPFYVFKNAESKGFNDNYVISNFSIQYTKKHQRSIEALDPRVKAVKFAFGCSNQPEESADLKIPLDSFAENPSYDCDIELLVALVSEGEVDIAKDADFLYQLYDYMKKSTDRDFDISVGYVKKDQIAEAKEFIRKAHTINYNWDQSEHPIVIHHIEFERDDNILDATYFKNLAKK